MRGVIDQLNSTIERIYAAAADGSRWSEALHAIEDLTGSAGAVVGFVPKNQSDQGFNLAGRFTSEQCATYTEQYQSICKRTRYMIDHPQLDVIHDSLLISEQEMDKDPVYDWFGRHDLRYFVGAGLTETRDYQVVCSLQRSPAQGHVQAPDIDLFKLLKPHLARAVSMADQLGTLRSRNQFNSAVLAALPQAVFALDAQGSLVFFNAAGRDLIAAADGISVESGRLQTMLSRDQALLDNAILGAIAPLGGSSGGWVRVSRRSRRLAYAAFVAPIHGGEDELTIAAAKALVIVHDPSAHACADEKMLVCLYGLTETEARVASALSGGHSLESAAALLRVRPSTARAHLKAVFRKVGVNRQQDLVRMLVTLSTAAPAI